MAINRNTRQKQLIVEEINKINKFFNADELYEKVNKKDSKIGVASVYRVLKDLRERRELHSYICDRKIIYSKENKSHSHFSCEKCGKMFHIYLDKMDFLKKNIKGEICHVQIDVSGICDRCIK